MHRYTLPVMLPVESSVLGAAGYDATRRQLFLRFHDSRLSVYDDVDPAVFQGLCAAESKGTSFNREIRPRGFSVRRLR